MAISKIKSNSIADDAITSDKVADGVISAVDVADGTLTNAKLADGTIENAKLAGSIANDKLTNSSVTINGSAVSLGGSVTIATKLELQTVKTSGFTAVAGQAYACDTTSAGFTVTLPATPSAGDQVQIFDYAGTFDTNELILNRNGSNIEGVAANKLFDGERSGAVLTYVDATQGWISTSGINEGTTALAGVTYSADFLDV